MTHIEILGPGCQKCQVLYEHAKQAATELGIEFDIAKVTDIRSIMSYGVMSTPALVVNGVVVLAGRVPTVEHLKPMLS
jgi:small redox-active disulfide protein 2